MWRIVQTKARKSGNSWVVTLPKSYVDDDFIDRNKVLLLVKIQQKNRHGLIKDLVEEQVWEHLRLESSKMIFFPKDEVI